MKLSEIQQKLKAPKSQRNSFGNYNYRNCEDILEAVKPLLCDATLTLTDKVVQLGDRYYVEATALFTDGEFRVAATAYAREALAQKGMAEPQITGAASSSSTTQRMQTTATTTSKPSPLLRKINSHSKYGIRQNSPEWFYSKAST
jgi:hypothetical protein